MPTPSWLQNTITQSDPAQNHFQITPNDNADLAFTTRSIYIGADGDLKITISGAGGTLVYYGLRAGMILPVCAKRVLSTGTSAGNLIGLY